MSTVGSEASTIAPSDALLGKSAPVSTEPLAALSGQSLGHYKIGPVIAKGTSSVIFKAEAEAPPLTAAAARALVRGTGVNLPRARAGRLLSSGAAPVLAHRERGACVGGAASTAPSKRALDDNRRAHANSPFSVPPCVSGSGHGLLRSSTALTSAQSARRLACWQWHRRGHRGFT
jgi:hypothetical protein